LTSDCSLFSSPQSSSVLNTRAPLKVVPGNRFLTYGDVGRFTLRLDPHTGFKAHENWICLASRTASLWLFGLPVLPYGCSFPLPPLLPPGCRVWSFRLFSTFVL
jgi:hypothetical protein